MATVITPNAGKSNSDKTVYFIDPMGGDPVDNKDLFIFVNLKAIKSNRSILMTDSSNTGQSGGASTQFQNKNESEFDINFIGYRKDSEGNHTMTTDWTNKFSDPVNSETILGTTTSLSNDVYEGFGIENIDIEVKAQAPPTVTIKFIDVRGGGLFDNETGAVEYNESAPFQLDKNNPYSIFFMLPRPLFNLTVKGFYGNPVSFCLYMISWDGTFNSETGNFEIIAKFIGYSFAFLQDIKIGHLLGATNTKEGREILTQVSLENSIRYKTSFPPLSIDDLMFKFNRITVDRENDQKNSSEFDKLRVINEQIKYLLEFKSYLGYASYPNIVNNNDGASFGGGIISTPSEQLFFRDVGIINKNSIDKYNTLRETISNGIRKYNEFKVGTEQFFQTNASISESDILLPEFKKKNDNYSYIRSTLSETLELVNKIIDDNELSKIIPKVTITDFSGRTQGKWPLNDTNFYVVDVYKIRRDIENKINLLNIAKDAQQEVIKKQLNEKINDTLGFKPTIKNVIGIICNNVETFLKMIRNTANEAEKKGKERYEILGTKNYDTDIPTSIHEIFPFPLIVDINDGKEKYLETVPEITTNQNFFPEIKLVQDMVDGLVAAYNQLQYFNQINGKIPQLKNNDYYPTFPGDLTNNPYQALDGLPLNKDGKFGVEFLNPILKRPFQLSLFYKFNGNVLSTIAELEAINFNDSLISKTYNQAFNNLKNDQTDLNSLLNLAIENNVIIDNGNTYSFYIPFNNEKIFHIDNIGDSESNIRTWNNTINLSENIRKKLNSKPKWESIFKPKNSNSDYIVNYYDSTNTYTNKCYFSLGAFKLDSVKQSILGSLKGSTSISNETLLKTGKALKNYNVTQLELIDISTQGSGVQYFHTQPNTTNLSTPFTQSSIYNNLITSTSAYSQGYLILSSLLFNDDNELLKQISNDTTKSIRLPKYYLLWLGAVAYRKQQEILSFNSEYPSVPQDKFYYLTTNEQSVDTIQSFSDNFIPEFEKWIQSEEFNIVKTNLEKLFNTSNLNDNEKKTIHDILNLYLFQEWDLIIYDSEKFITGTSPQSIDKNILKTYLETFMAQYHDVYKSEDKIEVEKKAVDNISKVVSDTDIKGAYYTDLKHIYDLWIAGTNNDKIFTTCRAPKINGDSREPKLIDFFLFVDKFRSQIAGDTIININSFNDLASQRDRGLFGFISKLLTDSYFMHYSLPVYVNFNNEKEVKKIFEPQDTLEGLNTGPLMLCVYNGPPSTTLQGNTQYKDDSFKFNKGALPNGMLNSVDGDKNSYLVAFNVNYGSQSQSIFKNIALTTAENRMTGEYITLLSNFIGTGQSKPAYKDASIFSLMRSRSYTSTIEMMGNMLIQPQMYYQLNNIPFFGGSYMIMTVSHNIKANYATTTFKGVRQTRHNVKIVTEATSYLNFQFNEGYSSGFTFNDRPKIISPQLKEQLNNPIPVLDSSILKKYSPSGLSILRAFNPSFTDNNHLGIDIEVNGSISVVNASGIIINPSDSDKIVIKHDLETDGYYYYTGYFNVIKAVKNNQIKPRQSIGTPIGLNLSLVSTNPLYYHFEIRRSKSIINTYDEYLKLQIINPQLFSGEIPTKQIDHALHSSFTN